MKRFRTLAAAALAVGSLFLAQSPAQAQDAASLPGGASSLQETYQDWRVTCRLANNNEKQCATSQQQARKDGQRLLTIELHNGPDDTVKGNLVLPFGLLFDAGIVMVIDEQTAIPPLFFRTCLLAGCIVPLDFDHAAMEALRAGTALKLQFKAEDGRDLAFSISLKGLSAALDRIETLLKG